MSDENWKAVVGYEGLYEVSDLGRVRFLIRRGGRPKNSDGIMQLGTHKKGYKYVDLIDNFSTRKKWLVHTLVMAAFVGPPPSGYEIDHKNGNKSDNRLSELEYVTRSENEKRAYAIGLKSQKGKNGILTEPEVVQIKGLLTSISKSEIARQFGVARTTINDIAYGRTWSHLQG